MADKFLQTGGGGNANLSNGSVNIFAATLAADNLEPSKAIKTNSVKQLISTNLEIADVNNLQNALDNVLTNPFQGTLQADDFKGDSIKDKTETSTVNLTATEIDLVATSVKINGQPIDNSVTLQDAYNNQVNGKIEIDDTKPFTIENLAGDNFYLNDNSLNIISTSNIWLDNGRTFNINTGDPSFPFGVNILQVTETGASFLKLECNTILPTTGASNANIGNLTTPYNELYLSNKIQSGSKIIDLSQPSSIGVNVPLKTNQDVFNDDELVDKKYVDDSINTLNTYEKRYNLDSDPTIPLIDGKPITYTGVGTYSFQIDKNELGYNVPIRGNAPVEINVSTDYYNRKWDAKSGDTNQILSLDDTKIEFNLNGGFRRYWGFPIFLATSTASFKFKTTGTTFPLIYVGITDNPTDLDSLVGFNGQSVGGSIYVDGIGVSGATNQWFQGDECEFRITGQTWQIYKNGNPTGSTWTVTDNGKPYYFTIINNETNGNVVTMEITEVITDYVVSPTKQMSIQGSLEFKGNPLFVDSGNNLNYTDSNTDITYPIVGPDIPPPDLSDLETKTANINLSSTPTNTDFNGGFVSNGNVSFNGTGNMQIQNIGSVQIQNTGTLQIQPTSLLTLKACSILGELNMSNNKIVGLSQVPSTDFEASNKKYVDDSIAGIPPPDLSDLETKTQNIVLPDTDNTKTVFANDVYKNESVTNLGLNLTTSGVIISGNVNTPFDGSTNSLFLQDVTPNVQTIFINVEVLANVFADLTGDILLLGQPQQRAVYTVKATGQSFTRQFNDVVLPGSDINECPISYSLSELSALRIESNIAILGNFQCRLTNIKVGGVQLLNGFLQKRKFALESNVLTPIGGKYSQLSPDITVPAGSLAEVSIIDPSLSIGNIYLTPEELTLGSTYHIKCAGNYFSNQKELMTYRLKLGNDTILDSGSLEYSDLNGGTFAYELEIDFVVRQSGASGIIYSNAQMIYIKNSTENSFRGNSSQTLTNLDLTQIKEIDITFQWNTAAPTVSITNRMVVITKMF